MKVTCDRRSLADALKAAGRFLPRLSSIPALSHFLVEAHSGIMAVTACDHESGRRFEIEADVDAEGDILAPGAFGAVVAAGDGDTVALVAGDTELSIETGQAKTKLRLGNRADYPRTEPETADSAHIAIDSWPHLRAVATVASTETARPILTGVLIEGAEAVATDSYRLAHSAITVDADHRDVLVPARAILALDAAPGADVSGLWVTDRAVKAKLADGAWWTRTIEGQYPKWRQFLDQGEPAATVRADSEAVSRVIRRAQLVVEAHIPIRLSVANGSAVLSVQQADRGSFTEALDAEATGEVEIAFAGHRLTSLLDPVDSVTIEFADGAKPALIRGGWFEGVLMPVRT